jgi:hypothetical protein
MRGGIPIVSPTATVTSIVTDNQITLPAGYLGSGMIGAGLITCVS